MSEVFIHCTIPDCGTAMQTTQEAIDQGKVPGTTGWSRDGDSWFCQHHSQRGCWDCAAPAIHQVEEVWFDFGEPVVRFCSTADAKGPKPQMCDAHYKEAANRLASAVLIQAHEAGATGPLWPTRWWVRYDDGYVIGGDVGPKPTEATA